MTNLHRPIVIIESPYAPLNGRTLDDNIIYLRECLRDSYARGEHPIASHAYYPFFLKEHILDERNTGIEFGYALWPLATTIIFCVDYGWSPGMSAADARRMKLNDALGYIRYPYVLRTIKGELS